MFSVSPLHWLQRLRGFRQRNISEKKSLSFSIQSLHSSNKFCHVSFTTDLGELKSQSEQNCNREIDVDILSATIAHFFILFLYLFWRGGNEIITNVNQKSGNTCYLLRLDSHDFAAFRFEVLIRAN